jgi:3-methyladenine DNA glycosylase Tag
MEGTMQLTPFAVIRARAEERKGREGLAKIIADRLSRSGSKPTDAGLLSSMSFHIFAAGISHKVVEQKWPGTEEAFLGFDPNLLNIQPDDFWHELLGDTRIIRHGAKINAIRHNAAFVSDLAREHGSAVRYLLDWPATDQIGLLDFLSKRGQRLGGYTGQYALRAIGKDNFVISQDVLACLKAAGAPITGDGSGKAERRAIQDAFDIWAEQSGLPMSHISLICAQSIG